MQTTHMQHDTLKKHSILLWHGLTKNDTNALKAICILIIVLHNFLHVFPSWNIENEFAFDKQKFDYFLTHFNGDVFNDFGLSFSYLGHYGVQMFVFLSAYGLYISYRNKQIKYWDFIKGRVAKLMPTFFLAVILVVAINIISNKTFNQPGLYLDAALRLSFLSNLIPNKSFALVGPWWFYSMIVQFYLIFPFLRNLYNKYGEWSLVVLSLISCALQILFNDPLSVQGILINTTVLGHIPVFALGMIFAKRNHFRLPVWVLVLSIILFYIGNLSNALWVFDRIWVTLITLQIYVYLKNSLHNPNTYFKKAVLFIGNISMYIFAVNGFLRHPFVQLVSKYESSTIKLAITFCYVLFVIGVALMLRLAEQAIFAPKNKKGGFPRIRKVFRLQKARAGSADVNPVI